MTRTLVLADALFDGVRISRQARRIVVESGLIRSIETGHESIAGDEVIDARDKLVLPGLVNAHVHIARAGMFEPSEPPLPRQVARNFAGSLAAGVTTVGDMGCPAPLAAALREAVREHPLAGPSLFAAGPLLTAPHGYPLDWMPPLYARLGAALGCGSEHEAERAVERIVSLGMDHIKLAVMHRSYANRPLPVVAPSVARAVVRAAHRAHRRVLAHAHSSADYRLALEAGVDALMHSSFEPLDSELLARIVDSGTPVCPTLWVFESVCSADGSAILRDPRMPSLLVSPVRRSLRRFAQAYRESGSVVPPGIAGGLEKSSACEAVRVAAANLALLADAGVPIVFGNDAAYGFSLIARPADELSAMQRAGLSPEACLRAATSSAAALLGAVDRGTIAPGRRADLLIVDPAVARDVGAIDHVHAVLVRGRQLTLDRAPRVDRAFRIGAAYARGLAHTVADALRTGLEARRRQRSQPASARR